MATPKDTTIDLSLRLPPEIHARLCALKKTRPHMSLNALIVESISQFLGAADCGQARELAEAMKTGARS